MAGYEYKPPKSSRELENAVQDDWKRGVVDAAKHRAVKQLEDYDGFKNMAWCAYRRGTRRIGFVSDIARELGDFHHSSPCCHPFHVSASRRGHFRRRARHSTLTWNSLTVTPGRYPTPLPMAILPGASF
jgi:hypothetical protein